MLLVRPPALRLPSHDGARLLVDAPIPASVPPYPARVRWSRGVSRIEQRWFASSEGGVSWLLRKCAKRLMPYPAGPSLIPTTLGFSMLVDPCFDPVLETAIYYHGIYEEGTLHVMRHALGPGDTFLDVGANLGFMTLAASKMVGPAGRVHAFEPHPDIRQVLQRHCALNGAENVTVHRCGLGAKPERRTLHERSDVSRGGASLVVPNRDLGTSTIEVDCLDGLAERSGIGAVRMLKIDVEGWELEVLKGAERLLRSPQAPILCVESSRLYEVAGGTQADIYRLLRGHGYEAYVLRRGKKRVSGLRPVADEADLPEHDNLFCFMARHRDALTEALFA